MKMKKNKKGFTLVELVIVIAVIAILAAVLIPTFGAIINNANKSAAEQEASNLRTALLLVEDENGVAYADFNKFCEKNTTVTDPTKINFGEDSFETYVSNYEAGTLTITATSFKYETKNGYEVTIEANKITVKKAETAEKA